MIVVTNQEYVGNLRGYHIYRATTFQILPLPRDLNTLSDAQIDDEQKFVHLLQDHLRQNSFYYSYGYDLTQSLQRQADMQREDLRLPMWQTASRSCKKKKLIDYAPTNNLVKGRSTFLLEQGTVWEADKCSCERTASCQPVYITCYPRMLVMCISYVWLSSSHCCWLFDRHINVISRHQWPSTDSRTCEPSK